MTWLKIESSVSRNRKFLQAGPAASWLWICGIAYCQEGLTDGFIPREALPMLGVSKDAERLATKLVIAGLWDACEDGGWRVHNYLDHNRSAADIAAIRAARAAGGKLGGKPLRLTTEVSPEVNHTSNPSTATATPSATTTATEAAQATSTDQQKLRAAATPRALSREPSADGNFKVIEKIAIEALGTETFENEADFSAVVKALCASRAIQYDSDVVARSCASAKVKRVCGKAAS